MTTGKVVLGVLAGVAAGALLGILFAPEKGSGTRKSILKKKDEITDELKEKFDEFIESVSEKYEKVKDDISEFSQQTERKPETAKEEKNAKSN